MIDSFRASKPRGVRTLRALALLVAVIFNLLLLLGLALYLLDDDDYRHALIWSADYFLDSQLEIDGAFSLSVGHEVELKAETVRLKANDGSYDLSVGKLDVEQRFGSYLITGKMWFNHVRVEDLSGEIKETGAGDEFDWKDFSLPFLVIEEVQLRKLSLVYLERDQQRHSLELSYILLDDTDNRGPVKVSTAGKINARPLRVEGTLGSLEQLRSNNQTYPVDFILSSDNGDAGLDKQVIDISGTVGHTQSGRSQVDAIFDVDIPELVPIFNEEIVADKLGHLQGSFIVVEEGGRWRIRKTQFAATGTDAYQLRVGGAVENTGQFNLHSEFGVTDPAAFGTRFGIDLTGYGPFKGKGLISGTKNKLNYQGKMSIGRIESETALTASLVGDKPQIKGKMSIAELYLADIGIDQRLSVPIGASATANLETSGQPKPEAQASTSADSQLIFDREPIDFSGLQHFNLDLEILVDQIIGANYSIEKLAGQARLTDGVMRISPMRMTFAGGTTDFELAVDTSKTPSVKLKVNADDLLSGRLVTRPQQELPVKGRVKLHMDVSSKGRSVHELASALAGKVDLDMENVNLPRRYLDYLATDAQEDSTSRGNDTRIEIDGAVALNFGTEAGLTAEAVRVTTDDGSYDLTLGKLYIQPDLASYLEKGTLWFHKVNIADLHAEITDIDAGEERELPEHEWHEFDWRVTHWPFVLIEEMQLSNLSLTYTKDDEQDTVKLSSLVLDNDNSEEPMQVSAAGSVNTRTLKLEGAVGTTAQPRGKNQVYPIDMSLSVGNLDAAPDTPVIKLVGSIDRTRPDTSLMEATFDVVVDELVHILSGERTADQMGQLQGSVTVADTDGRWGIRKININSSGTDLYQWRLVSAVDDSDKLDLRSEGEVPDPAAFGTQLGIDLSGYGAYKAKSSISGSITRIDYLSQETIGRIQSDTTLSISLVDGKPFVQGKFNIPNLYLEDIGLVEYMGVDPDAPETTANPHAGEQAKLEEPVPDAAEDPTIFDREPMDFTWLQGFDLDLKFLIDHITGVDFSIEKLDGGIRLNDGVLLVSPLRLTFEGGSTNFEFELNTRDTPAVSLKVTADDLQLENLMARLQEEVPVKGKTHLNVDLTSSGHSAHELASDLSGKLSFSLENARVPKKYVEFLTADLFGFLFRSVTFENSYTTLNCVLTGIEVDQGIAKTRLLHGEGPRLAVEGTATLDLGQETIDMVLLPKAKKRIGLDYSQITVKGPLADPDVKATGTGAATAAAVGGVMLIPEIIVPVFLIEQVWKFFSSDDDTGCSDYIEEHKVDIEEYKAK